VFRDWARRAQGGANFTSIAGGIPAPPAQGPRDPGGRPGQQLAPGLTPFGANTGARLLLKQIRPVRMFSWSRLSSRIAQVSESSGLFGRTQPGCPSLNWSGCSPCSAPCSMSDVGTLASLTTWSGLPPSTRLRSPGGDGVVHPPTSREHKNPVVPLVSCGNQEMLQVPGSQVVTSRREGSPAVLPEMRVPFSTTSRSWSDLPSILSTRISTAVRPMSRTGWRKVVRPK